MKHIIFLTILLLIPLALADTTFFDNPDDTFVMGSYSSVDVFIITGTGTTPGGGSCLYRWNCTNWNECLPSGKQIRTCLNIGTCPDTYNFPEIIQDCDYDELEISELQKRIAPGELTWKILLISISIISIILIIGFIIFYFKKVLLKRKRKYKKTKD